MNEFAYLDESLDINQTHSYHLSIQLGLNGLSFCILDTVTNKYVALRHYPLPPDSEDRPFTERIADLIKSDDILLRPFKSSAVLIESFKSTWIPDPLFRKQDLDKYFSFTHVIAEDETILSDHLKELEAWCVYAANKEARGLFLKNWPEIRIFHHTTPFLRNIVQNAGNGENAGTVHMFMHDQFFDLAVFRNNKLLLCNTYHYRQVNDAVYFVLYAFKNLKLQPDRVPVTIQGKINPRSSLTETLKRYVRKVSLARRNPAFTYSYKFNELEAHTYSNLFNLYLCV